MLKSTQFCSSPEPELTSTPQKVIEVESIGPLTELSDGVGGDGVVSVAKLDKKEPVAVKYFKYEKIFRHELSLVSDLKTPHPHVLAYFGHIPSLNWLVMEFCAQGDLHSYLVSALNNNEDWHNNAKPIRIALKVAQGLQYIHQSGILHNDIKPENIVMDGKGEPKIADFGGGLFLKEADEQGRVARRGVLGTVKYSAPECLNALLSLNGNISYYSTASDTFSFFLVLFFLTATYTPMGDLDGMAYREIARRIINGKRPDLSRVDNKYHGFFAKQWEHNPQERPALSESIQAFENYLKPS